LFGGDSPVFASGQFTAAAEAVDLPFNGVLAKGKTITDASAAVPPGYQIVRIDSGPPFFFEIRRGGASIR
jgi:hypothetical protein